MRSSLTQSSSARWARKRSCSTAKCSLRLQSGSRRRLRVLRLKSERGSVNSVLTDQIHHALDQATRVAVKNYLVVLAVPFFQYRFYLLVRLPVRLEYSYWLSILEGDGELVYGADAPAAEEHRIRRARHDEVAAWKSEPRVDDQVQILNREVVFLDMLFFGIGWRKPNR